MLPSDYAQPTALASASTADSNSQMLKCQPHDVAQHDLIVRLGETTFDALPRRPGDLNEQTRTNV
jgi:hypothetical protein